MTTLFQQLKTQYPKAALTAALVSVNEGQYVVRAAISQDTQEISSGLAASIDVQIAEDKARERAITALGIVANTDQTPQPSQKAAAPTSAPSSAATSTATTPEQAPTVITAENSTSDEPVANKPAPSTELPEEEEEDLGPPIDSVREESLPPAEVRPSAATIALENFNTSATPVDLSDVIAQTDVELTRLGWSNEQGREYLEKTYGKRSRQQLTDEELMSFLLYLEDIT